MPLGGRRSPTEPELGAVAAAGRLRSAELRGIVLALCAMFMFGLMDAASKYLSTRYPTPQIIWLRYVFTIPMALAILAPRGLGRILRSARPGLQVLRSMLLVVEIGLVVWCFGRLPLADVHSVLALTPLAVTALSVPLLGERVGAAALGGGGSGLHGRPDHPAAGAGRHAAGVAGSAWRRCCSTRLYQVLTRLVGRVDGAETSLLWQLGVGAAADELRRAVRLAHAGSAALAASSWSSRPWAASPTTL